MFKKLLLSTIFVVYSFAVQYSFAGIDDVEAFPSDYVGKPIYLTCKRRSVSESRDGGWDITASCKKADGDYDFMNNPFKLRIHTNNKKDAKTIMKSGRKVKYFLGTVVRNNKKYALVDYIFNIEEVQF